MCCEMNAAISATLGADGSAILRTRVAGSLPEFYREEFLPAIGTSRRHSPERLWRDLYSLSALFRPALDLHAIVGLACFRHQRRGRCLALCGDTLDGLEGPSPGFGI